MPLIVPILGMHRSGTSCLARILHRAGVYLGDELMEGEPSNLLGHWEAMEAVRINDDILKNSGGSWDCPPPEILESPGIASRIRKFLEPLDSKPAAGWKDPRTTLTFTLWRKYLPKYFTVICFRHPLGVANSLKDREGWPLAKGLALWREYNQKLLENFENEKNVFWFDYDVNSQDLPGVIQALCSKIQLAYHPDLIQGFNSQLKNYHDSGPSLDPSIDDLYHRLRRLASGQNLATAEPPEGTVVSGREWAELLELCQAQRQIQQSFQQRVQLQLAVLAAEQERIRERQTLALNYALEAHQFKERLRNSFLFRLRRQSLALVKRFFPK